MVSETRVLRKRMRLIHWENRLPRSCHQHQHTLFRDGVACDPMIYLPHPTYLLQSLEAWLPRKMNLNEANACVELRCFKKVHADQSNSVHTMSPIAPESHLSEWQSSKRNPHRGYLGYHVYKVPCQPIKAETETGQPTFF